MTDTATLAGLFNPVTGRVRARSRSASTAPTTTIADAGVHERQPSADANAAQTTGTATSAAFTPTRPASTAGSPPTAATPTTLRRRRRATTRTSQCRRTQATPTHLDAWLRRRRSRRDGDRHGDAGRRCQPGEADRHDHVPPLRPGRHDVRDAGVPSANRPTTQPAGAGPVTSAAFTPDRARHLPLDRLLQRRRQQRRRRPARATTPTSR